MSQQSNGSSRTFARCPLNSITYGVGQRYVGRAEIIAAPKFGEIACVPRPQPAIVEDPVNLIQVQKQLGQPISESVRLRKMTPVPDEALIHCGGHHDASLCEVADQGSAALRAVEGHRTPRASATSTALLMPSS